MMIQSKKHQRVAGLLLAALLSACTGSNPNDAGGVGGSAGSGVVPGGVSGGGTTPKSCDELMTQRVQPRLDFCRSCHVPGGVADVADGKKFMLAADKTQDMQKLRDSWTALGGNSPTSRILLMASGTDTRSHSGGTPWPVTSDAYKDVAALLTGFQTGSCSGASTGTGPVTELPLLGSKHAKHVWETFCEGKSAGTTLPVDPRAMIRPGINEGKAVFYNAWYEDCHAKLPEAERAPKTCGEYTTRRDRGLEAFTSTLAFGNKTAATHNSSWQKWGLSARPDNFDQMYTLRYGANHAPFDNPYPIVDTAKGIDETTMLSKTFGGSGQLPLGMRQHKDADGKWNGTIGTVACFACHGGQMGDPTAGSSDYAMTIRNVGLGNNNADTTIEGADAGSGGPVPVSAPSGTALLFNLGVDQRGQNNAVGAFELLFMLLDYDSLGINPNAGKNAQNSATPHPTAEAQDTPPWWNYGHRPRKFFDAGQSIDSTRIVMAAGVDTASQLVTADGKAYRTQIEKYDQDLAAFFLSLQSPSYPGAIDNKLAEQGAILFHTKNLWDQAGNADKPKPLGGNGSCASCHGAYSPRYVNDPAYLETPALEGVAGHLSPLNVIRTDAARSDILTPYLRSAYTTTFWGYPDGQPGWVAPEAKDPATENADDAIPPASRPQGACGWEQTVIGYQAPPLFGTWATAPYFHNGSVPTLDQVLKSSSRPAIWRRKLQTMSGVTGYDQSMARAYDYERLGWKHDVLSCDQIPGEPAMNCNPVDPAQPSTSLLVQNFIRANFNWTALATFPDPSSDAADKRFVYDTRKLGNGNGGHDFSDVLTEQERKAVLEYLKTL